LTPCLVSRLLIRSTVQLCLVKSVWLGWVAGTLLFIMYKNRDLQHTIYSLKRLYGQSAIVHSRTVTDDVDYTTGEQTVTSKEMSVSRAVLLPNNISIQRNFAMFLANFKFGGNVKVGDREVLIDSKDVPNPIVVGDYLEIQEKRYEIVDIQDLDGAGYHLLIRNSQNE